MESLEQLLAQALRHAHKNKPLQADLCACRAHRIVESTYGNPANWRAGDLIELMHRGKLGELSPLGVFQEFFYRRSDARKLSRFTGSIDGRTVRIEFVAGDYWLAPCPKPFSLYEETPEEILALQARFEELMETFEQDLQALATTP